MMLFVRETGAKRNMDVLSDIFDTIRLKGTFYFRTDFTPPWAITVPVYAQAARFHLVVQGRCHISLTSGRNVDAGPGDLVVIPGGREHMLADRSGRRPAPLEQIVKDAGFNGTGAFVVGHRDPAASTQLVCGHLTFRHGADHVLLRALPDLIVVRPADRARHPLLDEALRVVARCAMSNALGSAASIARLSEMIFIEIIRASVDQSPDLRQILAAMTDEHIGRALMRVHSAPSETLTVETLAESAGMSRSRFAERFAELIGQPPMAYVAEWRLQKALAHLVESDASIKEIAGRVGYRSAAAFTRAFTHRFGTQPTACRVQH